MKNLSLLILIFYFISCGETPRQDISASATLMTNVTIIDVRSGELLEGRQIVVDSGKITKIVTSIENTAEYGNVINGEGKYVLPGLAEMHAHIPPPSTSAERIEETLFLYLSNGITTIRGMLGDPAHLELRERAKTGDLLSPRIFTSSPSLNGNSVKTPEEVREKVIAYQKDGYDFLKIHPGIQLDVFDEMVKTANKVNIGFSGHVPVAVGIRHALESNFGSIDHIDGFLEGLVPETANVKPADNGFFGFAFTNLADVAKIDELVALSKEEEVWIVPTQSLFERWFAPISAEKLLAQPEMKYMPKSTLAMWEKRKNEYTGDDSDFNVEQWKKFDSIRKQLLLQLTKNGHGILLGSDAPQLFNVPGFSIHHEIKGMESAGMTPLEILKSGTINPARFFEMEDEFGEIRAGLAADFILLDSNPLEDLSALKEINGVMVQGKWLSKEMIDKKLGEIAANAAKN